MAAIMTCDIMGWTYDEYVKQPNWFIDLLALKHAEDKKLSEKAQ